MNETTKTDAAAIAGSNMLTPVYRYDIKCDSCGKFINQKELDSGGGASSYFIPDSDVSIEEFSFRCKKCTDKKGQVKPLSHYYNGSIRVH